MVWSEWKKEKATTSSPTLLILSPPQLFSITFKLLFTRSQRMDLKVLHPRFFFLFFYFKNNFSIMYLSAKQVFKVFVIVCLYMCGRFVFDQNFVLGFTKPYRIKSFFCHPMERISFLERTYVRCICYKRLRQTMPSSQTGENWVGPTGETQVVSLCWLFNLMYVFYVCQNVHSFMHCAVFLFLGQTHTAFMVKDFEREWSCTKWLFDLFLCFECANCKKKESCT